MTSCKALAKATCHRGSAMSEVATTCDTKLLSQHNFSQASRPRQRVHNASVQCRGWAPRAPGQARKAYGLLRFLCSQCVFCVEPLPLQQTQVEQQKTARQAVRAKMATDSTRSTSSSPCVKQRWQQNGPNVTPATKWP